MRQFTSIFIASMLILLAISLPSNPVEGQFATNTPVGQADEEDTSNSDETDQLSPPQ